MGSMSFRLDAVVTASGYWLLFLHLLSNYYRVLCFYIANTILGSKRSMVGLNVCQIHIAFSSQIGPDIQKSLLHYKLLMLNELSIPYSVAFHPFLKMYFCVFLVQKFDFQATIFTCLASILNSIISVELSRISC